MHNKTYLTKKEKRHNPSKYREIVRELKKENGKHPEILIKDATNFTDPYYVSLALFEISKDSRLDLDKAILTANDAIELVKKEERLWRRAELLTKISKKIPSWRNDSSTNIKLKFLDMILDSIISISVGKGLSDAIVGCAPYLCHKCLGKLLSKAVKNIGYEQIDSKVVIRQWSIRCIEEGPSIDEIIKIILEIEDLNLRTRLLGYLYLQIKKSRGIEDFSVFEIALKTLANLDEEKKLDNLKYFTKIATVQKEFEIIENFLENLQIENKVKLYSSLGGSADKSGFQNLALDFFNKGLRLTSLINSKKDRVKAGINYANGFLRLGEKEIAIDTFHKALEDCEDEKIVEKICNIMEKNKLKLPENLIRKNLNVVENHENNKYSEKNLITPPKNADSKFKILNTHQKNHILGLYDVYEGTVKQVHLRAIARASSLCVAFNLELALLGFPINDLDDLINKVLKDTNIGKGGKYLKMLYEQNRIYLIKIRTKESYLDLKEFAFPIATTSNPKIEKIVNMEEAIQICNSIKPQKKMLIIMGLGKKGLPKSLLENVDYHLELTGKNISLETCTAMGVIAEKIHNSSLGADKESIINEK